MRTDGMTETLVALRLGSRGAKILGKDAFCVCVCVCVCTMDTWWQQSVATWLHKRVPT